MRPRIKAGATTPLFILGQLWTMKRQLDIIFGKASRQRRDACGGVYESNAEGHLVPMLGDGYWIPRRTFQNLYPEVWLTILWYHKLLRSKEQWHNGTLIIVQLCKDNDANQEEVMIRRHVETVNPFAGTFQTWWAWLSEVKLLKQKNNIYQEYTTSRLFAKAKNGRMTTWQSHHQGQFQAHVLTGFDSEEEQEVLIDEAMNALGEEPLDEDDRQFELHQHAMMDDAAETFGDELGWDDEMEMLVFKEKDAE